MSIFCELEFAKLIIRYLCTLYKREDWVKRLRGGTYAESIVERFAHNTTWVENGDVNMRQYLSHA